MKLVRGGACAEHAGRTGLFPFPAHPCRPEGASRSHLRVTALLGAGPHSESGACRGSLAGVNGWQVGGSLLSWLAPLPESLGEEI